MKTLESTHDGNREGGCAAMTGYVCRRCNADSRSRVRSPLDAMPSNVVMFQVAEAGRSARGPFNDVRRVA